MKDKSKNSTSFLITKKIAAVIIWIFIFLVVLGGIVRVLPIDLDKDITIFITDEGTKLGLLELLAFILAIIGTIFLFKGYKLYRDKHWRFFDDEQNAEYSEAINRDALIYDLEKLLNLTGQLELLKDENKETAWRLRDYKYKINEIIKIYRKRKRENL